MLPIFIISPLVTHLDIFSQQMHQKDVNWSVKFLLPSESHIVRFNSALSNILLIDILVNLQP